MADYYKILEVAPTASVKEIKKAYKKLALKWHPDKNLDNIEEANRRFREISEAYEVLSDDNQRRLYNQWESDDYLRSRTDFYRAQQDNRNRNNSDDCDFYDFLTTSFTFRSPYDVFNEFFGNSFGSMNVFDTATYSNNRRQTYRDPFINDCFINSIFQPRYHDTSRINCNFNVSNINNGAHYPSNNINHTSGNAPAFKRTTTSTTFVNGIKVIRKKVIENGKETIWEYEDDVLVSKTVNGVPQRLSTITH